MMEALLGLLSTILPLLLQALYAKMEREQKVEGVVSDAKTLESASSATDVAIVFNRHDQRLRRLFQKVEARRSSSRPSNSG